jgi:hypothetical protein
MLCLKYAVSIFKLHRSLAETITQSSFQACLRAAMSTRWAPILTASSASAIQRLGQLMCRLSLKAFATFRKSFVAVHTL